MTGEIINLRSKQEEIQRALIVQETEPGRELEQLYLMRDLLTIFECKTKIMKLDFSSYLIGMGVLDMNSSIEKLENQMCVKE